MFCNKCGNEIKEGEKFCSKCGNKVNKSRIKNLSIGKKVLLIMFSMTVIMFIIAFGIYEYNSNNNVLDSAKQTNKSNVENNVNISSENEETGIKLEGEKISGQKVSVNFKQEDINKFKDVANKYAYKYFDVEEEELLNKYGTFTFLNYTTEATVYLIYNLDTKQVIYLLNYKCSTPPPVMILHDSYNIMYESIDKTNNKISWEFRTGGQQQYIYPNINALYNYQTRFAKYTSARDEDYQLVKSIVEKTNTDNIAIFNISEL